MDNAGPVIQLDTDSRSSAKVLSKMVSGTLTSPFPRFTASELEQTGILHCKFIGFILIVIVFVRVVF